MISLKELRDRLTTQSGYITTDDAIKYINTAGTVSATTTLNGLPLSHYKCEGGCSWSCSGTCTRGVGLGKN